jgi:hypothetical protein
MIIAGMTDKQKEALGRAAHEAFCESLREMLPGPPDWEKLVAAVKKGWIDAALAACNQPFVSKADRDSLGGVTPG